MIRRAIALGCLVACAAGEPAEPTARIAQPIVKGTASDPAQDAVVLVMHYDALAKGGGAASGCSGSLLTPRLVLTARHCVSVTDDGAACSSAGKPIAGGVVKGDHQPSAIYVFGGTERPDFISGTARPARGQEILTTGATTLCNNDIALVLLDRPLENAKIAPVRLDAKPAKGETVTVVGWGISDQTPNPSTRQQRTGVGIIDVGPGDQIGPAEFRSGEGTCQGDSGGPALAASGAVLGALSRGGNGKDGNGADRCLDATNIFSSVAGHADFIRDGYAKAGQEPWLEGGPNPLLAKLGATCNADADCQTNVCTLAQKTCSQDCATSACPDGFTCESANDAPNRTRLCVAKPPEDEGCGVAGSTGANRGSITAAALFTLAVLLSCRRRK